MSEDKIRDALTRATPWLAEYLRHLRSRNDPRALNLTNDLAEVRAALSSPHPEAREGVMDALDFASQIETALAKGAWKHTELANRIEMYAESRLAAQKDEGQDAREAIEELIDKLADYDSDLWASERSDLDGMKVIYPDEKKIRAAIEAIFGMAPAAPEPRPADEDAIQASEVKKAMSYNGRAICDWKGARDTLAAEVRSLRSQLARKDEGMREALEKIARADRAPHSYMTAYAEVVEEARAALCKPDGRKGE